MKKIHRYVLFGGIVASVFFFFINVLLSFLQDWSPILNNFNWFGEGPFELGLAIYTLIGVFYYVEDIIGG